jgi:hypothetical protein
MKPTDDVLQTENEGSIMNISSIFPEELDVNKGTTLIELKLPALTQCHILPSNNSGILIASRMGDSMSVSTLLIAPEQTSNPASPVAGDIAAGTSSLTQCHILPSSNSGILIASRMGDSMSVSTLPIAPKQTSNPTSPAAGDIAAGTLSVAETYQAVCIGTLI